MPPLAVLAGGAIAGGIGGALNQNAANKGPRAVFGGLQNQALGSGALPAVGNAGFGSILQMISNPGKLPDVSASVDPAFQSLVNANKQQVAQGAAGIREQFGASGLSNSSSSALGLSNFYSQSQSNFMNILSQYTLQAQQMAESTQLSATEFGLQSFLGPAFTETGPKGSVFGSALSGAAGGAGAAGDLASQLQIINILKGI
jgi:hypothetical protein